MQNNYYEDTREEELPNIQLAIYTEARSVSISQAPWNSHCIL